MKKLMMMVMGIFLLAGLAGEASAEVYKFKSDGLRAEGTFLNPATRDYGSMTLFKNEFGGYWIYVVLNRRTPDGYAFDTLFGNGQLPESTVTDVHGGVRVQFDSFALPAGTFSTYMNLPLSVDMQVVVDGLKSERHIGTSITRNPWLQLHINGITEVDSARLFGTINERVFPDDLPGYGSLGTSKGVTVLIEDNNPNE